MRYEELREARPWKRFSVVDRGLSVLDGPNGPVQVEWAYGHVETGRTRTLHAHFVKMGLADSEEFLGTDAHSLRQALFNAAEACRLAGYEPRFIGLRESFRERGSSCNTGWGEINGGAVHMMEPSIDVPDTVLGVGDQ